MPRQSRLDVLGALHHIIARGNERRNIFEDKKDCKEFLVRSVGGWLNLMEMRRAKVFVKGDERILGEGDFVEQILQESGEAFERKALLKSQGWDLDKLAGHVAKLLEIDVSVVWSSGKYRHIVEARSLLCYWAVRDLGVSMTSLANRLKLSVAAITQSVKRGERLKEEKSYHFL